jgi:hypothetical protein
MTPPVTDKATCDAGEVGDNRRERRLVGVVSSGSGESDRSGGGVILRSLENVWARLTVPPARCRCIARTVPTRG